jgi:bifunctional UDP-N-acetylglucosamine pyrophosphorylase/glucosamine-1-phosphate N-acetyltransferase
MLKIREIVWARQLLMLDRGARPGDLLTGLRDMTERSLLVVVLAAGKGTRMKSQRPKVLHKIGGRSMLGHVLGLAGQLGAGKTAVVVGPGMDDVKAEALAWAPGCDVFVQHQQLGTGDALRAAEPAIRDFAASGSGDVLVLYGDTPLLRRETLEAIRAALAGGAHVAVLGFEAADPTGYGRLLTGPDGSLVAIREEKDATAQERAIRLCNSGVMAFRSDHLVDILGRIGNANAKGEYYLTDAVEIARGKALGTAVASCGEDEVLGVNSRAQLAEAEEVFQQRARAAAMDGGATLMAPDTVYFSYDTQIGRDVVIEPHVFFGPGVTIGDDVVVHAYSHMEGARVATKAEIGPFARLRPGASIGVKAKIGNYVEVKNATFEDGAKANHLSYIGDGRVGAGANIGAGTIFCNYDGFNKHFTDVGAGAFVGSNSALVAPVKIGEGAYVGSCSVITKDVSPGALALERSKQEERPGWAARFREMMSKRKKQAAE